jgi:hypothetical protein
MTLFTRLIAIVVVEAIFLVVSLLLLGSNEISYTPAPADHFCGLIVKEHVGSWYCPVTLAAS